MRSLVLAMLLMIAHAAPALSWWQYAQWGMSSSQIASASAGRATPCRPDVPVCARPPGGVTPTLFVDGITMVGVPASASFSFDGNDQLVQTVVLFPTSDLALVSSLLDGIHGAAVEGSSPKTWRDSRRGTTLTATPAGPGAMLLYRPTVAR
jgi:hypothetical protein